MKILKSTDVYVEEDCFMGFKYDCKGECRVPLSKCDRSFMCKPTSPNINCKECKCTLGCNY